MPHFYLKTVNSDFVSKLRQDTEVQEDFFHFLKHQIKRRSKNVR